MNIFFIDTKYTLQSKAHYTQHTCADQHCFYIRHQYAATLVRTQLNKQTNKKTNRTPRNNVSMKQMVRLVSQIGARCCLHTIKNRAFCHKADMWAFSQISHWKKIVGFFFVVCLVFHLLITSLYIYMKIASACMERPCRVSTAAQNVDLRRVQPFIYLFSLPDITAAIKKKKMRDQVGHQETGINIRVRLLPTQNLLMRQKKSLQSNVGIFSFFSFFFKIPFFLQDG